MDGNESRSAPERADDAGALTDSPGSSAATRPDATSDTAPAEGGDDARPPTNGVTGSSPSTPTEQAPSSPATPPPATPTPSVDQAPGSPQAPPDPPAAPRLSPGSSPTAEPTTPRGSGPPAYGATKTEPPIFDLPDDQRSGTASGGTIVLGGAAAAEGRTTGPNPRVAAPASGSNPRVAAGDGEGDGDGDESSDTAENRGRHFSTSPGTGRNWLPLALAAVPVVALALLVVGWAVDTAALSGQVMRNVEVAGRQVGGLGEAALPEVMDEVDQEIADRPVVLTTGDRSYETTAGELGLSLDSDATAESALDAGRSSSLFTRPVHWLGSFFSPHEVDLDYSVAESQVFVKVFELQAEDLVGAQNPTIELGESGWVAVPGTPGEGVDPEQIAADLPAAAEAGDGDAADEPITIEAERVALAPQYTDEEAQALADKANAMTADGLTLTAGDSSVEVGPEQLRTWIAPSTEEGTLELVIRPDVVNEAVPQLFSGLSAEPVDASFDLQDGAPVITPAQAGITCCGESSPALVWDALTSGQTTAELEVETIEPALTTEAAEGLGIAEPVGGNNAWRNGSPTTAGPGFTTYHAPGQGRVTNIQRMADIVRGAVILPGETFSINEHVGPRTAAKGFVPAGAIRDGEHVDEIGGGVSQFATTLFNAAYFAGLDIPVSQAHSEYFDRYPRGREATMGHPAPDLQITNNTPHGVMIWTSYTAESLTVTMYSTPYATAEQTDISESTSGNCKVVTTTRTRTFPDGTTSNDTFRATYRPGDGEFC